MKNKIKALAYSASAVALAAPSVVFGAFRLPSTAQAGNLDDSSIGVVLGNITNWLLSIVGILGVIGFVVSGLMYITAAGDEKRIESAKQIMLYSIVGVVVALIGLIAVSAISGLFFSGATDATY
jgi:hypothetical protein